MGSPLTLTDLIVETAEGETEGSQELWQDSIAGQRGHAVNRTTRRLSKHRLAYVKLFYIIQAVPEHLCMRCQSLHSGPGAQKRVM